MRILHIDPFSGISGDMTVSALRDLGVSEDTFQTALASLPVTLPPCRFERSDRNGISGWRFLVSGHDSNEEARTNHHHHDHSHGRSHKEIIALLHQSSLEPEVRRRALSIFQRIAIAEGEIHGVPSEAVGFHEIGAEDSIADIVAACAGFTKLKIDQISCGPLIEGSGHIHCAHGAFPLPSPATLSLLKGIPFRQIDEPGELITPTGAAILAEFATCFGPMPEIMVSAIGYGLGSRQTPTRPNALRLILGDSIAHNDFSRDDVIELRCNLDDLTPEHAASTLESLLAAGALDATLTPTIMKKGRPAWILELLCHANKTVELSELILRMTTAFGIRYHRMERLKLDRHHREVETPYGNISVKIGTLHGEVIQQSPEFSSCAKAAAAHGVPVRVVHAAALRSLC